MLRNFLFKLRMSVRMWMRNRTRPLTVEEAEDKKLFWARIYLLCGGLTFLFVTTTSLLDQNSEEFSKSLPVEKKFIENMRDDEKIRVIRYTGFSKTSDISMTKQEAFHLRDAEKEAKNKSKENI